MPLKGPLSTPGQSLGQVCKFWTEDKEKVTEQWKGAMLEGQGDRRSHSAAWVFKTGLKNSNLQPMAGWATAVARAVCQAEQRQTLGEKE